MPCVASLPAYATMAPRWLFASSNPPPGLRQPHAVIHREHTRPRISTDREVVAEFGRLRCNVDLTEFERFAIDGSSGNPGRGCHHRSTSRRSTGRGGCRTEQSTSR